MIRYPQIYKVFEKVVKQRWEDFKAQGKPMFNNTADEYLESWYRKSPAILFRHEEKGGLGLI